MEICVISNQEPLSRRIRQAAIGAGCDCPSNHVIPIERAEAHLARSSPNVLIVATGPSLSTSLASLTRLRTLFKGPIVAVGPLLEPKQILGILRAGASDFIDEAEIESDLPASLERLELGQQVRTMVGGLVAVLSPSGGSGSSLVASNLAVAQAQTQKRCLLIDLKPRNGDLAALLDLKPSHTMLDVCSIVDRVDRVLLEQTLAKHESGVHLLAAPREFDVPFPPSPECMAMVLELGRSLFPRVVVDVDPALGEGAIPVVKQADTIVIVLRLEFNSLRNARSMIEHLERNGIDPGRIVLVGNRLGQPREIPTGTVEEALGKKFFAFLPDEPKIALGAQNNGQPVVIEYPRSRLARKLVDLAKALDRLPANVPLALSHSH